MSLDIDSFRTNESEKDVLEKTNNPVSFLTPKLKHFKIFNHKSNTYPK